ncbi:SDR family NAD(P)-dependent oxidoreductase [soil metagenome]
MSTRLEGRSAIITGAGGGIGRAMALAFANEGARVSMFDIETAGLEESAELVKAVSGVATPIVVDVTDRAAYSAAIDSVAAAQGGVDILVSNAMWIRYEPMADVSEETLERMLAIGIKAVFWGMQAVAPHMAKRGKGAIVNMSSPASVHGIPNAAIYCAIKGAVSALTRQAAVELGKSGIRVNAVAPGPTMTPGAMRVVDEDGWKRRAARTPSGRLSTPDEIALLAVFLASDDSGCVSGDVLFGDGGRSISAL